MPRTCERWVRQTHIFPKMVGFRGPVKKLLADARSAARFRQRRSNLSSCLRIDTYSSDRTKAGYRAPAAFSASDASAYRSKPAYASTCGSNSSKSLQTKATPSMNTSPFASAGASASLGLALDADVREVAAASSKGGIELLLTDLLEREIRERTQHYKVIN